MNILGFKFGSMYVGRHIVIVCLGHVNTFDRSSTVEHTIMLFKSKPNLVIAVATVLLESSRMTFRIAATPFEMSFSDELTGKGGSQTSRTGVVWPVSMGESAESAASAASSFRLRCCHFVTCDRTSLRVLESLICEGWEELKKGKSECPNALPSGDAGSDRDLVGDRSFTRIAWSVFHVVDSPMDSVATTE